MSAALHLLFLAILALQVHPFQLPPDENRPVDVQLLPPLPEDLPPPDGPALKRLELTPAPTPAPTPSPQVPPVTPVQVQKTPAVIAQKPLVTKALTAAPNLTVDAPTPEALRSTRPDTSQRIQVQRPPVPVAARPSPLRALDLQSPPSLVLKPAETAAPPAPPAPAMATTVTVAPPAPVSVQPKSEAVARRSSSVPVLTNSQTAVGPIEITPPNHPQETKAAAAPAGGAPPGGGGGGGGGANGGAGGGLKPYNDYSGRVAGFDQRGLHSTLGCLDQEAYHLSEADRQACLQRVAKEAKEAADLGLKISEENQAAFDRNAACRAAYKDAPMPSIAAGSTGTSVSGLGNVPRLRDCGPADR